MPREDRRPLKQTFKHLLTRTHAATGSPSSYTAAPHQTDSSIDATSPLLDRDWDVSTTYCTIANLWEEALVQYKVIAGVDIESCDSDLYRRLEGSTSARAIVDVLVGIADDFSIYRRSSVNNISARVRGALRPIARVVLRTGILDASGEIAAASSLPGAKSIFVAIGVLLQATRGVSERFDAVMTLLEKFGLYMRRLDVRIDAPFAPASRTIVVKILVEMMRTMAIVTQMMQKTRVSHFLSVLTGGRDDITDSSRRFEVLEAQDTQMTLVSTYMEVCVFSRSVQDAISSVEDTIIRLSEDVKDMTSLVTEMFMDTRTTSNAVSHLQSTFAAMPKQGVRQMADKGQTSSLGPLVEIQSGETGTAEMWRTCLTLTYLNATSTLQSLVGKMLSSYNDLTSADRTALRNGLALIYSAASIMAGGNAESAWSGALVNPGVFLSSFFPIAITYVAVFLCRKHIPRILTQSYSDTIVIIDAMGDHLLLPLAKYPSWSDVHALLLQRFALKDGGEYVRALSYTIMDTAGELAVIKPTSWERTVRPGMTLEMSLLVAQPLDSIRCPWCRDASTRPPNCGWVCCEGCKRHYQASSTFDIDETATLSEDIRIPIEDALPRLSPESNNNLGYTRIEGSQSYAANLFRRINVQTREYRELPRNFGLQRAAAELSIMTPELLSAARVDAGLLGMAITHMTCIEMLRVIGAARDIAQSTRSRGQYDRASWVLRKDDQ